MHDEELFGITVLQATGSWARAWERGYTENCHSASGTWSFCGNQTISQKPGGLRHALKNVTNCPSALPFLPPGCFRNLPGKFVSFDHACTTVPLRSPIAFRCASLCRASRLILRVLQL